MSTNLEIVFANFSFLALFISMIFYWIQTSQFGASKENDVVTIQNQQNLVLLKGEKAQNPFLIKMDQITLQNENNLSIWFISRYNYLVRGSNLGTLFMLFSNLLIFMVLALRWLKSGHFPLSNLYESLMFLSWSLTFLNLFVELVTLNLNDLIYSSIDSNALNNKQVFMAKLIGSITSPCALFTNAFASFSLPKEMQESAPLVPALQSNWLMMHVTVMILSYAALILGSLLSIGFLIITGGKELNETSFNNGSNQSQNLSMTLDNLSYRILGIGFPLLTIGILSGAVWANEAWGSYWSWDPKETWAFLTWLVFAIYLHTRLTKGWQGKKPALIASVGFITVWICYLGVNLIGEGLHSYGWLS